MPLDHSNLCALCGRVYNSVTVFQWHRTQSHLDVISAHE